MISQTLGNIMLINDVSVLAGDDAQIELEILNQDEFVGFQLDIPLPEGFGFIDGSAMFNPDRIADHEIVAGIYPGTSILRIMSYSLTNAAYLGNSGVIATFLLHTPNTPGIHTLEIMLSLIHISEPTRPY